MASRSDRFYQLFHTLPQGVVFQDAEGRIEYANPAAERILGQSFDEIQDATSMDPRWQTIDIGGKPISGDNHPAMVSLRTGKPVNDFVMGVFNPVKNDLVWLSISSVPLFREGEKKPYCVYATFTDISTHIDTENDLKTLFREMLDGFALHEIVVDDHGKPVDYIFLQINPAFERLTGLRREDVIGRKATEVLPGLEQYWIDVYGKVALTGEPVNFENFSGELNRHYKVSAFRPAANQFATIFYDVSDRVIAENSLKSAKKQVEESEKRFKALHNASFGGIVIHDKGLILDCNQGLAEITGYSLEELKGMDGLLLIASQDRETVKSHIQAGF